MVPSLVIPSAKEDRKKKTSYKKLTVYYYSKHIDNYTT